MAVSSALKRQRAAAALKMLFIGDALSMPVHWYYRPADILRAFPPLGITDMQAAPKTHPSSIMSLHSTGAGGRGDNRDVQNPVVGRVILKDKAHLWAQSGVHYHHGMAAGENTLNASCARLLMGWLTLSPDYSVEGWLQQYVEFMTADPPRHDDTYAESWHRGFFANLQTGKPLLQCGAVTHDTPSMGALVSVAPLALALLPQLSLAEVQSVCRQHVNATHPDSGLLVVVDAYVALMDSLMNVQSNVESNVEGNVESNAEADADESSSLLAAAAAVVSGGKIEGLLNRSAAKMPADNEVVGGRYSLACYITDSWPSVCYLAARYGKDPARALLVNTNLGGENAHRGSVLGSLVGLTSASFASELYQQLFEVDQLEGEIDAWLHRFYPLSSDS